METIEKEYFANWEEEEKKEFKKTIIPEDTYHARIKTIEVVSVQDFNNPENRVEKIAITCEINEKQGVEITHFISPKITKGSTNKNGKIFSNSKLYDLLVDLQLHEKFKKEIGEKYTAQQVANFLEKELTGKILKVIVRTSKANTPEQYSTISKILRIVPIVTLEKKIVEASQ